MATFIFKPEVTASPHIRSKNKTAHIMYMVILALLPAGAFGVYHFGVRALFHILLTVATCVASEFLYQYFMKKEVTVDDGSAVITGLLLAYTLPVSAPLWTGVIGGVFAIIVIKQLFGGLGKNFMNPALGARAFLLLSFPEQMTDYSYDTVSSATPLAVLKSTGDISKVDTWDMIIGDRAGCIGETCVIAILIGALILILFDIIDIKLPAVILVTTAVFISLFNFIWGSKEFDLTFITAHLTGGGLMLGAWFMATDYVTRPATGTGQIIYGVLIGLLTAVFRWFGNSAESVSFAIIFANILTPLIERCTVRKAFGIGGKSL